MSGSNGHGAATVKTKAKAKKKSRLAIHYAARLWIPSKPKALAARLAPLPMMAAQPATSSTISATRGTNSMMLCYSLHAAQPITYVTVTVSPTYLGVGGVVRTTGNYQYVAVWSCDLTGSPNNDVYLPPTACLLSQLPGTNPMSIVVTYDTANQQDIPAFSIFA